MEETRNRLLRELPSVDEVIKSEHAKRWLLSYPRRFIVRAIREVIDIHRRLILEGEHPDISIDALAPEIELNIERLSALSLIPVINATGIVIHTNLGRSVLSSKAIENFFLIASNYSNLEYDIEEGRRGKRYTHLKRILTEITGAEDAIAVNNNAGAVLLCLSTLAKGKEVIVSRGELVEIGGSFRVPEVMSQSGAILVEVGTTNKSRLRDYENAITERTAMILKVHRSNYKISGFTEEASISELSELAKKSGIPFMYDLGSGCLIDLSPFGITQEPEVSKVIKDTDIVTFSGDKLLGGPQAGIILGKSHLIERLTKNPLLRALRIDKLTLSALEATLFEYIEPEKAIHSIPTLRMLLEPAESIRNRAKKISALIKRHIKDVDIELLEEDSLAGGGSLPEVYLRTYVVSLKSKRLSANEIEERLRNGSPPVIARIKEDRVIFDARTIMDKDIKRLVGCISASLI